MMEKYLFVYIVLVTSNFHEQLDCAASVLCLLIIRIQLLHRTAAPAVTHLDRYSLSLSA
jgi:hypothetical protein